VAAPEVPPDPLEPIRQLYREWVRPRLEHLFRATCDPSGVADDARALRLLISTGWGRLTFFSLWREGVGTRVGRYNALAFYRESIEPHLKFLLTYQGCMQAVWNSDGDRRAAAGAALARNIPALFTLVLGPDL
jgi:hypothetical protein